MNLNESVFIIAEIGMNHNGDFEIGKKLIDTCKAAGVDCAKFQMRNLKELYRNNKDYKDEDLSCQYVLDLLNKYNLSNEVMFRLFDYTKSLNILPLCTPWDFSSFETLEEYGMWGYKTASADLTNHELLKKIALTGKPIFVSTGMSTELEIEETTQLLKRHNANFTLMHCNSTYPVPFKDINLNYIPMLEEISNRPVGYSGHERGIYISLGAVAKGARVIERHITLSRSMEGNDHKISLLPEEFKQMVEGIRDIEESLGSANPRKCSSGELINRESLAKSIVAAVDINVGDIIKREHLEIKSPGRGLQPNKMQDIVGKIAKRKIPIGYFLYEYDTRDITASPTKYRIPLKWGIPVRFHDYSYFFNNSNPDLLEFHLSYTDLSANIDEVFHPNKKWSCDLIVHSPDVFEGDHLLDLASEDKLHRNESIKNVMRVIEITKRMKAYFKTKGKIKIVASVGGVTRNSVMNEQQKKDGYVRIAECLSFLEDDEVEIIIQTLPPFPWYFGGQLFLNLFVIPEEISSFCNLYNRNICLDTSHSQLACNHYQSNFLDFVNEVNPYIKHIHVSDALGVDQEGVQIGEGDVNFRELFKIIGDVSFIPEIWQGHRNMGEECWKALSKIEEMFKPL